MRGTVLHVDVQMVTEDCCNCGIPFAMTKEFRDRKLEDKTNFYCPAGHHQHYIGKTDAEKEKEKREAAERNATRLQQRLDQERAAREHAERSAAATKGHLTRAKKRAVGGACPIGCCKRTFVDIAKHVQTKHPEQAAEILGTATLA